VGALCDPFLVIQLWILFTDSIRISQPLRGDRLPRALSLAVVDAQSA